MKQRARVGLGRGLGYGLGRRRKLRTGFLVGAVAACRFPAIRGASLRRGGARTCLSPSAMGRLGAARVAAGKPLTRLGDRLNARAETLRTALCSADRVGGTRHSEAD